MFRKNKKNREKKPRQPSALKLWWAENQAFRRRAYRMGVYALLLAAVAGGGAWGLKTLEHRMQQRQAKALPREVFISVAGVPDWMPNTLAYQIGQSMMPARADYTDAKLPEQVYELAKANPWVKRVLLIQKKLSADGRSGLLEVVAEYRRPAARVAGRDKDIFVDADGVRLPTDQVPQWVMLSPARDGQPARQLAFVDRSEIPANAQASAIHYITINGVQEHAPRVGCLWKGDDIRDGLRLAQLIYTRKYANQVMTIDVRNYGGRVNRHEPFLRMAAQTGKGKSTDIKFGRFPLPDGDHEIPVEQKFSYLDQYYTENRTIAGINNMLDLQHDELHVSVN